MGAKTDRIRELERALDLAQGMLADMMSIYPRPMVEGDIWGHRDMNPAELTYQRIYYPKHYFGQLRISGNGLNGKHQDPTDCTTVGWIVRNTETQQVWVEGVR